MVVSIPAIDSYGTLIGLEEDANANNAKDLHDDYPSARQSEDATKEQRLPMLRPTHLLLPPPAQTLKTQTPAIHTRPRLSLPRHQDCDLSTTNNDVDVYLQGIPSLQEQHRRLLRKGVVSYTAQSPERLVYVHQGEVAHAVFSKDDDNSSSSDCDILLSDKATTCHILALHSRPRLDAPRHDNMNAKKGSNKAITSLTHLDGCDYDQCLRDMIQEHKRQHASTDNSNTVVVNMQVSIVGGFNDEKRHSQALSNWLLPLLADIADEEASWLQMTLQTCLISTMNTTTLCNDNNNNNNNKIAAPLARGLAIDTRTGAIHLADVTTMHLMGPHFLLRNARLWAMLYEQRDPNAIIESTGENRRTLQCLHGISTTTTAAAAAASSMEIQPFYFEPLPPRKFRRLMNLTDAELLRETSSSPLVEDAGFCNRVRRTFLFMQQVGNSRHVFTGVSSGKNDRLGRHHHPRHHHHHQHHRHDHHPYHPRHHHHSHTGDHHKASSLFGEDGKFGRTRLFGGSGSSTVANNNDHYKNTTDTGGHRDQQQPLRFRRRRKPGRNNDWILVK